MKRTLDAQASHAMRQLATGLRYVREAEKALRAVEKARRLARETRTVGAVGITVTHDTDRPRATES